MKLDQFYTKEEVSKQCLKFLKEKVDFNSFDVYLEPSAGDGSFLKNLPKQKRVGLDLSPRNTEIKKQDFFDFKHNKKKKYLTVGNPPFGKRSSLALGFFNKAAEFSDVIAFIVPIQFKKYGIQSKIPKEFSLIAELELKEDSFLDGNKDFKVRAVFQIWEKNSNKKDLRIKNKPAISHDDFEMYLYNNTKAALKFFDYNWDFAVPRQGYVDYTRKEEKKEKCEKRTQWMFFKAKDKKVLSKLMKLDFEKMSKKNTKTPGFGKADVIEEYLKLIS